MLRRLHPWYRINRRAYPLCIKKKSLCSWKSNCRTFLRQIVSMEMNFLEILFFYENKLGNSEGRDLLLAVR